MAEKPEDKPADKPAASVSKEEFETLKTQHADLMKKFEALSTKKPEDDPDLKDKAKLQREADDKKKGDTKALESALSFNMSAQKFITDNATLLPKEVSDIIKTADKENYDDAIQKASAVKAAIVQTFFSVQANLDLLTPALKTALEDFLKLSKNGKQEKALGVYDSIFEPAFEMLKRVKKAELLNKGYGSGGDAEEQYKQKMISLSKKHHLGEKTNAT